MTTPTNTDLTGQKVLVIGGSKFLGKAIAEAAAAAGATVIIGARDLAHAQAVAAELPGDASAIHLDITVESNIAAAASELGAVDHIVITASAHHNVPVTQIDKGKMVTAFDAKVFGPMLVAKYFAPKMPKTGSILLFSGVAAWNPGAPYTIMGVSNGAVAFLASNLANELAPIRVNAISPGIIDSGTYDGMDEASKQAMLDDSASGTLVGRGGTTKDIVDTAMWLMGAGFVTGETIHVEGGSQLK